MKIKDNFVLRQVADCWVVLPLAAATLNFNGMLKLNDSGALLWRVLEQSADMKSLVAALTSAYDISAEQAEVDVNEFLRKLAEVGCIEI